MGLTQPNFPDVDLETWREGDRSARLQPMARHVAESGFGTPDVVYVLYAVKIAVYVLGGALFALSTTGVDGLTAFGDWWDEPVVFQKVVLWTMLFEVLGLGCGFGPLNLRITPPLGSFLYWLRPGTVRLAPWPTRVPGTGGDSRTPVDVALYAALLGTLLWALLSDVGSDGLLPRTPVVAVLVVLGLVGLRDKVIFLAARAEVYGSLVLTFLLAGDDVLIASQVVMVVIWWGAATSKLNRHFPHVVASMLSNSPLVRSKALSRRFWKRFPDDLRPSRLSAGIAHTSTGIEFLVPLALIASDGGTLTTVAAVAMLVFHLNILVSMPNGAPLEWNVFMMFAIGSLFVAHADLGPSDLSAPLPVALLFAALVAVVAYGNARPDRVSFLPAMRYYAGNWDTSIWCFSPSGLAKLEAGTVRAAPLPYDALKAFYGEEQMTYPVWVGYAFRSMHTHGRALFSLVPRALGEHDGPDVTMYEGELVAGIVLGWNFGDGHLHGEQLAQALQARCGFAPGEVRIVLLEAQPIQRQVQRYRLHDPAVGQLEHGEVDVRAMLDAQPWETVPVRVLGGGAGAAPQQAGAPRLEQTGESTPA